MKTVRQIFCDFGHNFLLMLEAKSSGIQLFLLLQFLLLSGRRALAFPGHARWRVPSSCHCTLHTVPFSSEQCAVCSVQCWRGRGSEVLQAWEPEQTALRKVFTMIIITMLVMGIIPK